MKRLEIDSESVFEDWLKEEEEYLATLSEEPLHETLEMEYYTALLELFTLQALVDEAIQTWTIVTAETIDRQTHKTETTRQHLVEKRDNTLKTVQILEAHLETQRWEIGCKKWHAIDNLEHLVISWIFELTKMNMSHTGYKMRKHIGKALQSRLQAIWTALERYNNAACALDPPRATLRWEQVIDYAFLSDFDLLRDPGTREGIQDMSKKTWATPAGRAMMDRYFKIKHAEEEVDRLNIEIPRLLTYMADEDQYLKAQQSHLGEIMPTLAHQICCYRLERAHFYDQHHKRFPHLSGRAGVMVSLSIGKVAGIRPGWNGPTLSEATVADETGHAMTGGDLYDPDCAVDGIDADDDDDQDDTDDQVEEQLVTLLDTFSL
ncbi:uncharacterized protein EV420DRAFT_1648421 [Desarmillaria tabescens]|uniref:Uncharacterized protein n=1 Tax=Armillaria tabescens TaxID=1929756 RepID=A0AA39JM41_ARMTA|nr:uncharacterized protein EV420DRAFT_1648421 [Desarmillaria tabescens]KAK0445282.1 hypothetical protein EV420DRAFT_1648421 [Desarmillaria tabescens]